MEHQSTTMTFIFLRLSEVKILLSAAIYTKNATLKEALSPNALPRKWGANMSALYMMDLTSNIFLLEGIQQILSSPPCFNLRE